MSTGLTAQVRLRAGGFLLDAALSLPGRGVTAVIGPSGAGKSTLLRWMAGLEPGAEGRLDVNGVCWEDTARRVRLAVHRRGVGYLSQHATLFPHLDVRANLEFGLRRVAPSERQLDLDAALTMTGIAHLLRRDVAGLSGGERQRIGLARALLNQPHLLLLDEPLAALDLARKREILPCIERLHDSLAIPILYVSHAPEEVARLADHVVLLEHGGVRAQGPLETMLARLDLDLAYDEDAGVVLGGSVGARDTDWHLAAVDCAAGRLWVRDQGLAEGTSARLRILARDVSIALTPQTSSILNTLPATIDALVDDRHPAQLLARLAVGDRHLLARLTRRSASELGLAPGRPVWAQIKAVAVL